MARIRTVKPEFFTSPDTAKASVEARLFYIALWCWADDWGVGEANLNALLGFAFPEDDEKTRKEVQSLCKEVANTYGTVFYENNGRYFYQIPAWDDHQKTQRRAKRRNPTADDPESQPDKRIYGEQKVSEFTQGNSETTQGNDQEGTGEQGNRGTGEHRNISEKADAFSSSHFASENDDTKKDAPEKTREDILTILDRIDQHCDDHGFKKPNRTKQNLNAARLMLDKDERTLEQINWIMDWVTAHHCWASNIMSASKLREKFDQLKGQAINNRQPGQHLTASQRRLQEGYEREQRILNGELTFDNTDNPYMQPRQPRQAIEGGSSWTPEQQ